MIIKILKYIVIVLITILGLLSILFTAPFSKTTIDINLGTVAIGIAFLIYALFTLYVGSVLTLISSFWHFPRKVIWFLGITSLAYFVLVLNNLIIFAGGGVNTMPVFVPLVLYVIASFRFFRRLAKGRK